jgi:gas vesicle protein
MNKILIAFTSGIVVGILFAPAKGRRTREKISNIGAELKEGWNCVTDKVADKIDGIRERFDTMSDKVVEKVESTQFDTGHVL